ncbi:hypothetical protein GCM10011588_48880 [Nocardia jinanensis]|uniref:Uncharacterized protein n=1 Tax=Nocardia jinanensis TaxID=382504 RepID=A0A917VVR6_9NOCA|nr:hypothetical protein GCM10011588_48880 [Nocardia jinanensis]
MSPVPNADGWDLWFEPSASGPTAQGRAGEVAAGPLRYVLGVPVGLRVSLGKGCSAPLLFDVHRMQAEVHSQVARPAIAANIQLCHRIDSIQLCFKVVRTSRPHRVTTGTGASTAIR